MSIFEGTTAKVAKLAMVTAVVFAFGDMPHASAALAASSADDNAVSGKEALPDPATSSTNPLSDAGTSGYHLYARHCKSCHGFLGSGSKKASRLTQTRFSQEHTARKEFHEGFRHGSRDHIKVARGTRKKPGPKFNDIELIGKFLREVDAWHAMLESVSTE